MLQFPAKTEMKKFVGKMVGDGSRKSFDFRHDLGTTDFVYMTRNVDGVTDYVCNVQSVGENNVLVTWTEPLEVGEDMWITLIG